jgi:integrase
MFQLKRAGGEIGRRDGLKSRWAHAHEGSTPSLPIPSDEIKAFTLRGKPLKDIRTAFENACRRDGIKKLRFHDLRHTFATRLVLSGVDLVTVSKLLGHSSIQMTMRYSHPTPEALKNAVFKLDEKK